jgi:hypothetical protein
MHRPAAKIRTPHSLSALSGWQSTVHMEIQVLRTQTPGLGSVYKLAHSFDVPTPTDWHAEPHVVTQCSKSGLAKCAAMPSKTAGWQVLPCTAHGTCNSCWPHQPHHGWPTQHGRTTKPNPPNHCAAEPPTFLTRWRASSPWYSRPACASPCKTAAAGRRGSIRDQ